MRRVGGLSIILSILGSFGLQSFKRLSGIDPGWYGSLIILLFFVGGISLLVLAVIGAYVHSIVLMSRDEYN
jgi:hypothetical protein